MSFRSALAHRSFLSLWLAQLISRIGDSVHEIAMIWLVYEVTGDPTLLSAVFVASFLPTVLFSIPAGALVDAVNRKYVLMVSDVVRGTVVLAIPLYGDGPLLVPLILTVAFVTGLMEAFFRPARTAIIPKLVPESELDSANALTQITFSVSQVLFALGGLVVAAAGSYAAFYVDSASFFVSAAFLFGVSAEQGVPEPREDAESGDETASAIERSMADVKAGIAFVRRNPVLQSLIVLLAGLQLAVAPVNVAAPIFATSLPFSGSLAVGFVYSALFTGIALGSTAVSRYSERVGPYRGKVITAGLATFGVFLAMAVSVPSYTANVAVILVLFALAGIFFASVRVPATTLAQVLVPDEKRGRFMSISNTITSLAFVVGLGAAGPAIELIGARATMLVVSVFAVVLGVAFFTQPIADTETDDAAQSQA